MCWVWLLDDPDESDVEDESDEDESDDEDDPEFEDDDPDPDDCEVEADEASGIGTGGMLRRSSGMSGGGTGGCPLISSAPLALFSRVDQPPLPRVAPMLQDTWWLPADQLGSEIVL